MKIINLRESTRRPIRTLYVYTMYKNLFNYNLLNSFRYLKKCTKINLIAWSNEFGKFHYSFAKPICDTFFQHSN